jgi:MFS family permease
VTDTAERPTLTSFWHDLPRDGKLLLSVVVYQFIGTGLVLPFWVVYLHEMRGFGLDTVGLLLAVLSLGGFLAAIPTGGAIDRFGARRVQAVGLALAITGQTIMVFATTLPIAFAGLMFTGASFGIGWPAAQSLISTVVPTDLRQRYFGVNFSLLNLGIGLGGIIGGFAVDTDRLWTFQAMYVGDAASYVLPLVILLGPLRHAGGPVPKLDDGGPVVKIGYAQVFRRPAVATLVALTFVFAFVGYGQLNTGMPAYARAISEVSTRGLGFAFAANTLVIVLFQLAVLKRIEGRRRTRVLMLMSVVWGASWLLLGASGLVPGTLGATLLVAACASVFAIGETLMQPTLPAIVNDLAPDELRGRYNALQSGSFQLAAISAPIAAGLFIDRGLGSWFIGTLLGGLAVVAWLSLRLERQLSPAVNGVRLDEEVAPPAPVAPVPQID